MSNKRPIINLLGEFSEATTTDNIILPAGLIYNNVISPASLLLDVNNYNPAGLSNAKILRVSATLIANITGIAAQEAGRELLIINIGLFNIGLTDNSASSTASNRILGGNGANKTLQTDECALLWYDGLSSRWRVITINN